MSELSEAVQSLRNMREAYDQLGAAAEAYNAGKVQLAANITEKGVQASASETLPDLADKVAQIAQDTIIYEGADSYGKQIGAGGYLWDLYQVLADMKTRFMGTGDYAALIVCEYYKGYDSLVLQGADGYYTCDGDYYDYASQNHVWHDDDNDKMNRWVAFLYRDEGARLDITNTSISPRSMYIGGHIGTIKYFVDGRLTDLVCGIEETDILDNLDTFDLAQGWNNTTTIRGVGNIGTINKLTQPRVVIIEAGETITSLGNSILTPTNAQFVRLSGVKSFIKGSAQNFSVITGGSFTICEIPDLINASSTYAIVYGMTASAQVLNICSLIRPGNKIIELSGSYQSTENLIDVIVGAMDRNLNIAVWNPTNVLADHTKKAQLIENIKNHILARVSDVTGGTQLVFTISTNMYNNIASEQIEWQGETMSLADAFLTKNWLLAGA